jgi:hypothetical protein
MAGGWATVALILIVLGWVLQLYYSASRKIFALSFKTVVLYVIGCILLVIDALGKGSLSLTILNLGAAVLAFLAGYYAKKARPKTP